MQEAHLEWSPANIYRLQTYENSSIKIHMYLSPKLNRKIIFLLLNNCKQSIEISCEGSVTMIIKEEITFKNQDNVRTKEI